MLQPFLQWDLEGQIIKCCDFGSLTTTNKESHDFRIHKTACLHND